MDKKSAATLKRLLLDIYKCEKPFELLAINRKPRTRMGVYIVEKQRINVYAGWSNTCPLEEIAIHECAHHIHETEKGINENRKRNEFTVLNFGEFIPPYCLSLKEKVFLLTHISLTSLTVRSPHYNNNDYEKSYAVSQNGTSIS